MAKKINKQDPPTKASQLKELLGISLNQMSKAFTTDVNSPTQKKKVMKNAKLIGDRYRDKEGESLGENIFEFIDPTGISSWNDVGRSYKQDGRLSGKTFLNGVNAIPVAGKITKPLVKGLKAGEAGARGALASWAGLRATNTIQDVSAGLDAVKKKKKYAYGGTTMDMDSPSESLSKIKKVSEDALFGAMNDSTVMSLRGLGTTLTKTGMSMIGKGMAGQGDMEGMGGFLQDNFGNISTGVQGISAMSGSFAYGGTSSKPAEVEGQEVYETPDGGLGKFFGPSHEAGGIKTSLPEGTDIYSKRVKVNGVKMADRKIQRELDLAKLEKLSTKNPFDVTLKQTLKRVKANTEIQDEKDMQIQNILNSYHQGMKKAFGGTIGEEDSLSNYEDEEDEDFLDDTYEDEDELQEEEYFDDEEEELEEDEEDEFALGGTSGVDPYDEILANDYDPQVFTNPLNKLGGVPTPTLDPSMYNTPSTPPLSGIGSPTIGSSNFSLGDLVGMGGSLYGAFSGRKNTLANRAGDTPNINPYKNYGQDGLKTLDSAFSNLNSIKDQNMQDIERSRTGSINRNNNSARGINTLRALNLATDSSINNTKNKAYSDYANKVNQLLIAKSGKQDQRDRISMQGEGIRDMNDRKDRDNFYTQMGQDNQSIAQGIQNLGKHMNTSVERDLNMDALSMLSKYFGLDISATGVELTNKK